MSSKIIPPLNENEYETDIQNYENPKDLFWRNLLKAGKEDIVENTEIKKIKEPHPHYSVKEFPDIHLNRREMETLKLKLSGLTYTEIGRMLKISSRTVEYYLAIVRRKTQSSSIRQLIEQIVDLESISEVEKN